MLKMFFAAGTALTLLFGAVGVGAAAAQNSQPGEPLYALKAWGEPLQFMFQAREQVQTQTMNGLPQLADGQQAQNQVRTQSQAMLQSQQMNGQMGPGAGQQNQDQLRMQTQTRLQDCQTLDPSVATSGDQDRDQTRDQDQTQDRLHTHQSLDQTTTLSVQTLDSSVITSGDQDRDQTQDQTQDRLRSEDCIPDPVGSAAQNQNGGPHTP